MSLPEPLLAELCMCLTSSAALASVAAQTESTWDCLGQFIALKIFHRRSPDRSFMVGQKALHDSRPKHTCRGQRLRRTPFIKAASMESAVVLSELIPL